MHVVIGSWMIILALHCVGSANARAEESELCRAAIAMTERVTFVPDRLMQAIGIIESGRRNAVGVVQPWPWTINVEGVGEVFDNKEAAIAAVQAHRARGARSIDVGCMQVNLLHHGNAFASLDQAFDPAVNTRYAARFLQQLLAQTGSWPRAVAGYHSLTPDIGAEYARKVLAIWARPEPGRAGPPAVGASAASNPPLAAGPGPAMSGMAGGRVLANPAPTTTVSTGRGLESYRARPNRSVSNSMFRHL